MFFDRFRKKEKPEKVRKLTAEERQKLEADRKEFAKWQKILANVDVYDGTEKGQQHIGQ